MPKQSRLTRADFSDLKSPRRIHGDFFVLSVYSVPLPVEGASAAGGKFACVVSKKVALRANARNLIKRRCRAVFREHRTGLASDRHYVFTAKKQAKGAEYADIKSDIVKLLTQGGH